MQVTSIQVFAIEITCTGKKSLNGFVFQIMDPREWECRGERKVDLLILALIFALTLSILPLDFFLFSFWLSLFSFFSLCVFFLCLTLATLLSCPYSWLPLSLLYLLKFIRFLPFVPQAVPTTFGFLWASVQDYPLTCWLPDHYLCSEGAYHTTFHFQTKFLILFLSHSLPCPPSTDKG